jgi:hypothetical protein
MFNFVIQVHPHVQMVVSGVETKDMNLNPFLHRLSTTVSAVRHVT